MVYHLPARAETAAYKSGETVAPAGPLPAAMPLQIFRLKGQVKSRPDRTAARFPGGFFAILYQFPYATTTIKVLSVLYTGMYTL